MKLTAAERRWLKDLQAVLDACPSQRLGFYTIGDHDVSIYDRSKEAEINEALDANERMDFPSAVLKAKAETDTWLKFPAHVHSVAG